MPEFIEVTDYNFDPEVLKNDLLVIADFWAEWCGPCKQIEPFLNETQNKYGDLVKLVKVDIDDNPKTTSKYSVLSIPTLVFFRNGIEVSRLSGQDIDKEAIFDCVTPHLPR